MSPRVTSTSDSRPSLDLLHRRRQGSLPGSVHHRSGQWVMRMTVEAYWGQSDDELFALLGAELLGEGLGISLSAARPAGRGRRPVRRGVDRRRHRRDPARPHHPRPGARRTTAGRGRPPAHGAAVSRAGSDRPGRRSHVASTVIHSETGSAPQDGLPGRLMITRWFAGSRRRRDGCGHAPG